MCASKVDELLELADLARRCSGRHIILCFYIYYVIYNIMCLHMYIYIYIDLSISIFLYLSLSIYIYIYIYLCICIDIYT